VRASQSARASTGGKAPRKTLPSTAAGAKAQIVQKGGGRKLYVCVYIKINAEEVAENLEVMKVLGVTADFEKHVIMKKKAYESLKTKVTKQWCEDNPPDYLSDKRSPDFQDYCAPTETKDGLLITNDTYSEIHHICGREITEDDEILEF